MVMMMTTPVARSSSIGSRGRITHGGSEGTSPKKITGKKKISGPQGRKLAWLIEENVTLMLYTAE